VPREHQLLDRLTSSCSVHLSKANICPQVCWLLSFCLPPLPHAYRTQTPCAIQRILSLVGRFRHALMVPRLPTRAEGKKYTRTREMGNGTPLSPKESQCCPPGALKAVPSTTLLSRFWHCDDSAIQAANDPALSALPVANFSSAAASTCSLPSPLGSDYPKSSSKYLWSGQKDF
jgi:hypothetical protein